MALTYSEPVKLNERAPNFKLPAVDGKTYELEKDFGQAKAVVIVFMCNHCPYVVAVKDRINGLAKEYGPKGVAVVGINSNDAVRYPDDSFAAMKQKAKEWGYVFPYLFDETQEVARAYGALCTPDIFVVTPEQKGFSLQYRGRIDDNWKEPSQVKRRDLALALDAILAKQPVPRDQQPSMGCSIKWK